MAAAAPCRRAAASYTLAGPPSKYLRQAVDANFNNPNNYNPPPGRRLTANGSPTFVSTGDPCLDFFFHVVPGTPARTVASLLAAAWAAEPLTALRLACNLRGVRGTGKADREGFYAAALWMHACHPATLALNARSIAEFGYLKDLPEILRRIIHDSKRPRELLRFQLSSPTPQRATGYGDGWGEEEEEQRVALNSQKEMMDRKGDRGQAEEEARGAGPERPG
ncbi:hypothetical protein PR202_ga14780 [Eleusine coracana subsp. coracana]|uniref:DUF2828 domain-containing protein n=1 Tax=Eleusine coracana subsp. coracana TaxID=191504 RepID=A0AAV5CIF0_ELECO|nr:hypothetical protein PR202_ga14780 [Eleusine coracana subsp. coracana]